MVKTIALKIDEKILERINEIWRAKGFQNRSEFIRYLLRKAIEEEEKGEG